MYANYHKVIWLDSKEVPKISESHWRIGSECKVCVGVCWGLFGSIFGEGGCLHSPEVLHEDVSIWRVG